MPTASGNIAVTELLNSVRQVPGVTDAAAISGFISDYTPNTDVITESSANSSRSVQTTPSMRTVVSDTFFRTAGIPLILGRFFSEYDNSNHPAVALINETMAHQFWPGQDAVGKRFRYGSPGAIEPEWLIVVGIVADTRPYGPGSRVISRFYRPYSQAPGPPSFDLIVRCEAGNCARLTPEIKQAVRSVNRGIPRFAVQRVTDVLAQISAPRRFQIWLLGCFSGIALCLATVGIYGLLNYLVSQRTQEIGVRIALGATVGDVLMLILKSGLTLAAFGIGTGICASFFLMRLLQYMLFGISVLDPITISFVSMVLLGAALAASYFPARTAARLDPVTAMRRE